MNSLRAIFLVGVLSLVMSTQAYAKEDHTAHAIEHAAMAKGHGKAGDGKILFHHANIALEHARKAEKEHADARQHMAEGVKHLEEAMKLEKSGDANAATKHTKEALVHIIKSTSK